MSCPFCKNSELDISEATYWTGMRSETLSFTARHWCDTEGFDRRTITLRGKTKEDVLRLWNERSENYQEKE